MKIARLAVDGQPRFAVVDGDQAQLLAADTIDAIGAGELTTTGETVDIATADLLAPVVPTKVIAMSGTYLQDPAAEFRPGVDREPFFFLKPPSSVIGPKAAIEVPEVARGAAYEVELGIVIGTRCKGATKDNALDYVLGYTVVNDASAGALMQKDGQWARGKGLDTFCPVGPVVETEIANPDDVLITASVVRGGETIECVEQSTSTLVWSVAQIIEYVSEFYTLEPGDIIATGCPPGVIAMEDGDEIHLALDGVGELVNPVRYL
ncbi:fumarylacetoacetate hydrolase family protein [Corynebacterium uterequi]|uniref:2-keto-4-pentenoate hydratase/2-oxohepta-3-ene-1,7-dioic acid hydratase n=1 Tax=Corynebacterium uterequi TaxID=1072256 RepID=A0A0G3HAD6_9CORY|nr:fumarylacetoacetate hydrolase family protein [Corynebacterium uterequi]AKK10326.1 2-keto-4-pentenoate hydratase/2-oxohepta-3-ene-1,7-dioic acid hydratase [Corynebacterium uterequi]